MEIAAIAAIAAFVGIAGLGAALWFSQPVEHFDDTQDWEGFL